MSMKKINAGDTLTVGDLTDDHLGAVIEVGPRQGITERFRLDRIERDDPKVLSMWTDESGLECAYHDAAVKVITPPPVVQPDEPTTIGQCIRIDEEDGWWGIVVAPEAVKPFISARGTRWSWAEILDAADGRRIIVADPPRWPDETSEADEALPVVVETLIQWAALPLDERRKFAWVTCTDAVAEPVACGGWWYRGEGKLDEDEEGWSVFYDTEFPLTRGERVE